ncbi:MAG: hypothetical protein AB2812_03515, partial [Candidatus Sedimenticola endophacoides]
MDIAAHHRQWPDRRPGPDLHVADHHRAGVDPGLLGDLRLHAIEGADIGHGALLADSSADNDILWATHCKERLQVCRYLVKDFGTSQSPKSTRQRDSRYCPD